MKKFKPILAPNEHPDLSEIKYPLLASYKLDGIRCIFYKGEMLSRSLKPIVNKQLREKFQPLINYTKESSLILDGEIYSHELTFQEITRYVMTQDFEDKKSIKKFGKVLTIPDHLKFYCFDGIKDDDFDQPYVERTLYNIETLPNIFNNLLIIVSQAYLYSKEEVEYYFQEALDVKYEGLILRDGNGKYKCGRCTIKEGNLFKVKPFRTFDGKIIEVTQGTEVNPDAEKKTNELGRSVTSKKKEDRILVDRVRDFVVEYENGNTVKVSCSSLTHEEREKYWKIKDELIGQWIEYKGMLIGAKDVPRHPVFIRFREPKE